MELSVFLRICSEKFSSGHLRTSSKILNAYGKMGQNFRHFAKLKILTVLLFAIILCLNANEIKECKMEAP